jgi:hypothetical protein
VGANLQNHGQRFSTVFAGRHAGGDENRFDQA